MEKKAVKKSTLLICTDRLAMLIAASAIHQVGGPLEDSSRTEEKAGTGFPTLLDAQTDLAMVVASDIMEVCNKDPYMFLTMVMAGVTSVMVNMSRTLPEEEEQ